MGKHVEKLTPPPKKVVWNPQCKEDLSAFPQAMKDKIGHELFLFQTGQQSAYIKPFRSKNAQLFEVAINTTLAYRLVFASKAEAIYPLHAFSKSSNETPSREIETINERYKIAEQIFDPGKWHSNLR